jgi:hypothetical protein
MEVLTLAIALTKARCYDFAELAWSICIATCKYGAMVDAVFDSTSGRRGADE